MAKVKDNKQTRDFSDIITLRNLKRIIVICFILSILCEFLPSMFDICKLLNYNFLVVLLQPHKDFFTNIALGCLGSAVISYIMLYIPSKIKEKEEIREISVHLRSVISDFLILYAILEAITVTKSLEDKDFYINDIKTEKNKLYASIKDYLDYYGKITVNIAKVEEVAEICQNKLLFAIKEIDIFVNIFETYEKVDNEYNNKYPINVFNESFKLLYDNLNRNYDLKDIRDKFASIVPPEIAAMKDIGQVTDSISDYINVNNNAVCHTYYAKEIYAVYKKYEDEIIHEKEKDVEFLK